MSLDVITVDLPGHVVNNRGEVGGSVKTHRFETLVIGLHHPLNTTAVWVLWIAILCKKRDNIDCQGRREQLKLIIHIFFKQLKMALWPMAHEKMKTLG